MDENKKLFDDPDDILTAAVTKSWRQEKADRRAPRQAIDPKSGRTRSSQPRTRATRAHAAANRDLGSSEPDVTARDERSSPYLELIAEQLAEERARKQSLEQRGFTVLSTSGFFVSLLFGVLGWLNSSVNVALSNAGRIGLTIALGSLIAAATAGVSANLIRGYNELSLDAVPDLYARLDGPPSEAERRIFRFRANVLHDSRSKNDRKAVRVRLALTLQMLGATAIGFVVLDQLLRG